MEGRYTLLERLKAIADFSVRSEVYYDDRDAVFTVSHRIFLEGVDFDLTYTPLKHLGYKTVLAALGPIYAGGSMPLSLSVRLALSQRFTAEQSEEIWRGIAAAVREHKITNIDLELLPSVTGLAISLVCEGKIDREGLNRKPVCTSGDLLCVNGSLGAAYMGLQILEREKILFGQSSVQPQLDNYKYPLQAYLSPYIDLELLGALDKSQIVPSAGEFIVNGLADAVKSLCLRHHLGAKIFMNRIAIAAHTSQVAEEFHIDPMTAALNGGDDYIFLFAVPLEKYDDLVKEAPQLDIVGHLCDPASGTLFVTSDGTELELKAQGWSE